MLVSSATISSMMAVAVGIEAAAGSSLLALVEHDTAAMVEECTALSNGLYAECSALPGG